MDLLFNRYASPYLLLDEIISQNRLVEFINELGYIKDDEKTFDVWLHKVEDKTFDEFKESLRSKPKPNNKVNLEAAIKNSKNILNNFVPTK